MELETLENSELRPLWGGLLGRLGISRSKEVWINNRPWLCPWAAWQRFSCTRVEPLTVLPRAHVGRWDLHSKSFQLTEASAQTNKLHASTSTSFYVESTHTHTLHVFGNLINKSSTCSNSTYEYMGNPASLKTMETCSQSFLHQTNDCFLFGPLAPHGGSTTDVPLKLFYIYFCMHVYKYKCTYIYTYIKSWIYKYVIINIHVPVKICGHLGE